jgi:hypothetical protein
LGMAQVMGIYVPAAELTCFTTAGLMPPKATIRQIKLNNRCLVYGVDGSNPLFFDLEGRGHAGGLLPTVRASAIHVVTATNWPLCLS